MTRPKPHHAENKRLIQTALGNLAAFSGRPTPERQLAIATAKPKRAPNKPRTVADELTEHQEQSLVASWFYQYARTKQLDHRLLVAIPNGNALYKFADNPNAYVNYLKSEGMRPGFPDLALFVARGQWHGLLIEMKRKTRGIVSPEQNAMIELLIPQGYLAGVCRGADEAIAAVQSYLEG